MTASASSGFSISDADEVLGGERDGDQLAVGAASPLRTRSNAVSKWWVKAATCSKPNIAPEPLIVCRARNAVSIRSWSPGDCSRSSSACLELLEQLRGFLAEDFGGISVFGHPEQLLCDGEQLVLLERLGDPAGGAGGLGLLLHVRRPIRW